MSQQIRSQGGYLVFGIGPKNTSLVEDIEILLPVKFRQIPFSCFRGEVENVSANQKPGWPSYFSDQPKKHKLGRGRWDLASCQVSLNSVQLFQRRSRKCLSQSEARAAILFFRIWWTNGTMHQWGGGHNKRPKGPHIVHLSTMCHLFDRLARAAILFFLSAQKTQTW